MPMKPRTFRRVVLLGSLGAIVLLVVFGYFVVRPWQNQRQLEAMRTEGIVAYESGDYINTVKLLGRYKKNAENPEPEIFLYHARASEKYEATDGGNYLVAVDSYREYLRRVPDDVEAKQELLPLMNLSRLYVEAEGLARELIDTYRVSDIAVLEELNYALVSQQGDDEEIEAVLRALFEHEDSKFSHANTYLSYLRNRGRGEEADALLDERIARFPGRVEEQLLEFQRDVVRSEVVEGATRYDDATVLSEICSIIGLNPETLGWEPEAPSLSPSAAWFTNRILNSLRRPDLATSVQLRAAEQHEDRLNTVWAARRLYWAGRDTELRSMDMQTEKGEPDADVLGYQFLSAEREGDEETSNELKQRIRDIDLDRRARAWSAYINAIEQPDGIQSRIEMQNAIDWYPGEPVFRLRMGELQLAQGRFNEAVEHWVIASETVNDEIGSELTFDTFSWSTPLIRIINAYSGQDRLVEAFEYTQELLRVAPNDYRSVYVAVNALSQLARQDQLPADVGQRLVTFWEMNKGDIQTNQRIGLAAPVAAIHAYMGEDEGARAEIAFALQNADGDPAIIVALYEVDDLYKLGVADAQGLDYSSIAKSSPLGALRAANRAHALSGRLEDGLSIIDEGLANADDSTRQTWERVRVAYLDAHAPEQARDEWERLLTDDPEDIELLYAAIESKALSGNLERIDELIARVTTLTSTEGKALPSRLRLARANAMVAGEGSRTRTNRSRAMEIIRAVVAAEPTNTKARNMLGRILSLPASPEAPENERYEPDYEGAIEQYLVLARQLSGKPAQDYLLECVDLAYRGGDEGRALVLLDEYEARFGDDIEALPGAAERFENLGEDDRAIALYERVLAQRGDAIAALALADLQLKEGDTERAMSLLQAVGEADALSPNGVLRLASLYVRAGDSEMGREIASSGERFGLEPIEARLLQSRFAELYLSDEEEIATLREATEIQPKSLEAWKRLVLRLVLTQQLEQAAEAYSQAVEYVEPDQELMRYGMMAQNAPQTAEDMFSLPGMQENPRLREVIQRVENYTKLPEDADPQTRVGMMRDLIRDFPQIEQAQIYASEQLAQMRVSPAVVAGLAYEALKNAPWNTQIMQIAGQFSLQSADADGALRAVSLWRANSLENTIVSNAIRARALIQKGDLEAAEVELEPFVEQAIQTAAQAVSREVLDAYSYIRLSQGESPSVTASRLQPLISTEREIRNQTWLRLASSVITDAEVGAEWIRVAEGYSSEEDHSALASAWVTLAFTHARWDPEYANRALDLIGTGASTERDAGDLVLAARANLILARAKATVEEARSEYERVVQLLLDANAQLGGNVGLLLDSARYANEAGIHDQTVWIYKQIQAMNIPDETLEALVSNNLAMSMVRAGVDQTNRDEMLSLAQRATSLSGDNAAYWGTRGWVELELDMYAQALESFTRAARLQSQNAEGWVGLAIANHELGPDFESGKHEALERLREITANDPLSGELKGYLDAHGLAINTDGSTP